MSFCTARVAPEEAVFRPALPLHLRPGLNGTAMARKAISKKTRFEVFKRDGFKCMYCGAEAPKAVLHVDHVNPVAKGGGNDMLNIITACEGCNSGKSDRVLSDDSAVAKQRAQLDDLHERREQMEMMLKWRDGLADLTEEQVAAVQAHFAKALPGWYITKPETVKVVRSYIKKSGLAAVLDAIDTACERYIKVDEDGRPTPESVNEAWQRVGGILHIGSKTPEQQRLHYVKGILNKRLSYVPFTVMRDLEDGLDAGIDVEDMVEEAKRTRSWSAFNYWLTHEQDA